MIGLSGRLEILLPMPVTIAAADLSARDLLGACLFVTSRKRAATRLLMRAMFLARLPGSITQERESYAGGCDEW